MDDLWNHLTIWEACRATTAMSTFFDPILIGPSYTHFIDGSLRANNPVGDMLHQATVQLGPPERDEPYCLVSIGIGELDYDPFSGEVAQAGADVAFANVEVASYWRQQPPKHCQYFRFNVSDGLEDIGVGEAKQLSHLKTATDSYLNSSETHYQLRECASMLTSNRSRCPLSKQLLLPYIVIANTRRLLPNSRRRS